MYTVIFVISLFFLHDLNASYVEGKVSAILAGDTFEVTTQDGEVYPIVLKGIDSPEIKQEFGPEAKQFLEELLSERDVMVYLHGKDRFRNYIGIAMVGEDVDIRVNLVREGFAWITEAASELDALRADAVANRRGLWAQDNPTPPWVFRRQQSMLEAKSR